MLSASVSHPLCSSPSGPAITHTVLHTLSPADAHVSLSQCNFSIFFYESTLKMQASESCVANTGLFPDTTNWQLSDFSFRHLLGTGSYGKVRLCVHKPSNEIYAVKCLKKAENLRPAKVQHILSEARIMCNIEHPFIIKLCQTFQVRWRARGHPRGPGGLDIVPPPPLSKLRPCLRESISAPGIFF